MAKILSESENQGFIKPSPLELARLETGTGRLAFPGKVKRVPGRTDGPADGASFSSPQGKAGCWSPIPTIIAFWSIFSMTGITGPGVPSGSDRTDELLIRLGPDPLNS